ncbi:MAG: hypothetical protein HOP29_15765 [Phycisphaerales bacterium]|nr:hypothetical protein [Phycisphaerales bacterium]
MLRELARLSVVVLCCGILVANVGCPAAGGGGGDGGGGGMDGGGDGDGGDGDGGDGGGGGAVGLNLTDIAIHVQGRIAVGDDMVAYTDINDDRTPGVVNFFVPSDDPVVPRSIDGAENFDEDSFAVSGKKIILSDDSGDRSFGLTVFDTETGTFSALPIEEIRLVNIPIGNYATGYIQADGGFVVTRNDTDDDIVVKIIDIRGDTPVVIPLTNNPGGASSGFSVQQVAVDAESELAVAVNSGVFHVYDINAPDAMPTAFDVNDLDGIADEIVAFGDGVLLYSDDSEGIVYYLDVTDAANTPVAISTPNRGARQFQLRGLNFGFVYEGPASQGPTAAIGVMPSTNPNISEGMTILENSANLGRFGYGDSLAVAGTDAAPMWFLGGIDDVLTPNAFQQSSTGAAWTLTADEVDPTLFFTASDVTTNAAGNLLVFKYEINDEQFIGFADTGN